MNSQYINQHNQSTVETVTAMTNMFFKQKSKKKIKHMHTKVVVVVVVKIFVCLPKYYAPDNIINVKSSRSVNLPTLFFGRCRPPKTKSRCIP